MRRLALIAGCCAVPLLLGAVPAPADNGPHVAGADSVADNCAGCHRVHGGKADEPLTESSQTALCYTCHGTSGTGASTDVEGGVGYPDAERAGSPGALRGGGFEYAVIDSTHPSGQGSANTQVIPARSSGQAVNSTHSVDSSSQTTWGNGAVSATANYGKNISLRCGSCHDPHGNGNYRILRALPSESGAADPGVVISDAATKVYTTENYWQAEDTHAPSFIDNISAWCATCHTRYNAPGGSATASSGDAVHTYGHSSNDEGQGTPTCIQCHVSHGSNASMSGTYSGNVTWPDGTPAGTDSRLLRIDNRGTCQMCHDK